MDELHIYLMLPNLRCAFDFYFDSAKVDEQTAMGIAKSLEVNEAALEKNSELSLLTFQWIETVNSGDGKAQYELFSTQCKAAYYDYYGSLNWITDSSASWLKIYSVDVIGNISTIFYGSTNTGKYEQTLTSIEENGGYYIDSFTEPKLVNP